MRMEIAFIILLWLALQIPLGSFIGDCIRFRRDVRSGELSEQRLGKCRRVTTLRKKATISNLHEVPPQPSGYTFCFLG